MRETETTRRWRDVVAPAAGLLVAAVAVAWTVTVSLPVTVTTASGFADVGFGWPLPWYHQDLSKAGAGYAELPVDVTVVGDRVDPVPTRVDWAAFAGDVALTALVLWPIATVAIRALARLALKTKADSAAADGR